MQVTITPGFSVSFPSTYIVTMEKYGYERSKRVRVLAHSPEDAMAVAMGKCKGWMAVDVEAE
jgi:hypothetical protein